MQVEVWPNAPTRTEYPLPAPLDGTTTLRSVIVRIDDAALLCVRIDPQDLEVREVLYWSKEKGFERLEVELGHPNPQVIVSRRLLWFLDDDKPLGPHARIHFLTPDSSYTGEMHDVECSFVTPQGARWVMHWMFHPHRERMSTTMSAYMSWTSCLTVVDDGRKGGVVNRWSKNYEDPTYESGVFGTTETGGCDFEACGKYGSDYIVKLPSLDVVPISGRGRAVMKGPPNPPEEARYMRAFMGRGWSGTTIYLSGAGRLFRYETSSSESRSRRRHYGRHMDVPDDTWVDIRVPGCDWIAADGLLSSNSGDLCMFALAGDVLTISEVSPYRRDRPDSYSRGFSGRMIDEDLERMYDIVLRIGHTDFKVIASVFCLASQSDVLRNLFFGAFSENIHSSKQARHERVMDLTELVGDCPDAFASIHTYLMRDSQELDTGFTTLDIVIDTYRVCRVLGLRTVEYEVEEHICFKYLDTDKVMELIADLDVDDTSALLRGRCAACLLTLVVNAVDKAQEWARIREVSAEWADECMKYVKE